jgi:transcriptional regulator with GAF, ATPase, and Fis domain
VTPKRQGSFKDNPFSDLPTMNEMQRRYLNYVFKKTGGLIGGPGGAAEILGMKRTTVNSRKKKLGIS